MFIQKKRRRIVADDEVGTVVSPETTELLFETEDVANLLAEATGESVEVETSEEGDAVDFTVGDQVYTVMPDEDVVEVLESVRRPLKSKRTVSASTRRSRLGASTVSRKVSKRR